MGDRERDIDAKIEIEDERQTERDERQRHKDGAS